MCLGSICFDFGSLIAPEGMRVVMALAMVLATVTDRREDGDGDLFSESFFIFIKCNQFVINVDLIDDVEHGDG